MEMITATDVWKVFKLIHGRPSTLKGILLSRRSTTYEKLEALKGVSFSVNSGETLAIVGRNGSGKSTLLSLMARVYKPTKGEMIVRGRTSALLELGAGFHPDLTGIDNIYLNSSILGLSRKETDRKFDDIVEFSELGKFIDAPIRTYSTGMVMRLGFSIAIQVDPDILLIDEVLAVGDAAFQGKCTAKIREFQRQGKTIVFVSHNTDAVRQISTRAIWLEKGVVRESGSVDSVMKAYLSNSGN